MSRQQALNKLGKYREQLARRADNEYEAAVAGYQALADGKVLLDLEEAFVDVPTDAKDRPMLAIGRADRRQVYFSWLNRTRFQFSTAINSAGRESDTLVVTVGAGREFNNTGKVKARDGVARSEWPVGGYALVPMVPADVRPNVDMKKCHVLWEVPEWADQRVGTSPTDPYLIQHLAGSLYVVLAEWELTPLERAITRGRIDR
jgi:hypothetical protein